MSTINKFGPIYTILDRFRLVYINSKQGIPIVTLIQRSLRTNFRKIRTKLDQIGQVLDQFEQYQTSLNIFKEGVTTISDKFRPMFLTKSHVNPFQKRAIYFSWNHKNRHK